MRFEWDPEKAARNERIHGVSFEEACEVFTTEAPVLEVYDVDHSETEDRFKSIGPISRGLVLVVWTERKDDLVRVILVTDAGFRGPWFRAVEAYGWDWVGRIRNKIEYYRESTGRWCFTDSLYPQATTSPRYIGEVALSRRHRYQFRLYLVRAYKPRIGRPKRRGPKKPNTTLYRRLHRAPWLLATSLPHEPGSERRIKQIYTKRMQIEETFRDLKSHRWGFGLRYARCNTAKRLEILLLLGTLATLVAWLIGLAGRTLQWNWQLQTNTTRKRQVLSTFFIGRQLLARPALEIPPPILELAFAALQRDLIAAAEV